MELLEKKRKMIVRHHHHQHRQRHTVCCNINNRAAFKSQPKIHENYDMHLMSVHRKPLPYAKSVILFLAISRRCHRHRRCAWEPPDGHLFRILHTKYFHQVIYINLSHSLRLAKIFCHLLSTLHFSFYLLFSFLSFCNWKKRNNTTKYITPSTNSDA